MNIKIIDLIFIATLTSLFSYKALAAGDTSIVVAIVKNAPVNDDIFRPEFIIDIRNIGLVIKYPLVAFLPPNDMTWGVARKSIAEMTDATSAVVREYPASQL